MLGVRMTAADITFAQNMSVIPASPASRQSPSILRERNLLQQRRSCKIYLFLSNCTPKPLLYSEKSKFNIQSVSSNIK